MYLSASFAKGLLTNATFECCRFLLHVWHKRPKQVNCHSVHHGWTIFVFNNQHCILIRSINHFGGRWNVVALWPLLYTNCPTALPWLSAAGCVRAHPAQCDAQVSMWWVNFWSSILKIPILSVVRLYDRNSDYEINPNHFKTSYKFLATNWLGCFGILSSFSLTWIIWSYKNI